MNRLALFLLLISVSFTAFSNGAEKASATEKAAGIMFHEGTWAEALELAKSENKPIFLDVYATWCGPCKRLKKNTFSDQEVGDFFNAAFINVAVDGENGEGLELARKYGVNAYPSLIFIDEDGQVISYTKGYHNAKQFLGLGQEVLKKK
jgi:thioredoxin 1